MTASEGQSLWARLVDEAYAAFEAGKLGEFEIPPDAAKLLPLARVEDARMMILAAAFQRWLQKEFRHLTPPPGGR